MDLYLYFQVDQRLGEGQEAVRKVLVQVQYHTQPYSGTHYQRSVRVGLVSKRCTVQDQRYAEVCVCELSV